MPACHAVTGDDRGHPCPRYASRAAAGLRLARPALALQGLGARVRLELRDPAPAARRVLPALRRAPRAAPEDRHGRAELRDLPLRRAPALDVRRIVALRRRIVGAGERRDREEGAPAAAAPARGT